MGKNISVYLDDDTIKWLDALCGQWGLTRGKAIATVLQMSRGLSSQLVGLMKAENPTMYKQLEKLLKESE